MLPTPGKQTLVEALVQQMPDASSGAATDSSRAPAPKVQAAAAQGIAGSAERLPFGRSIQQLFGRHDIGGIKAHTDGAAAAGASAIGAKAFAAGDHVVFGAAPDLHTAAHEAAHVVQQRGGIQLKGGVGEAGDPHEQHANQVADRVVAGASAEDLLDRYAAGSGTSAGGGGSGAGASPVQRQVGGAPASAPGAPAPAPTPGAPAPAPKEEAYHAPTSARDPDAPAARNADEAQIHNASTDKHVQQALDIDWIEGLPTALKNSIDQGFADSVAEKKTAAAAKTDAGLKTIDKEINRQLKELHDATLARLAAADPSIKRKQGKALEEALAADPIYAQTKEELEADRVTRVQARKKELREAADGPMAAGNRDDTVVKPSTPKITRLEGKALARTNFMSWAVDILGSSESAKRHFRSIRDVAGQPGMLLIDAAATRFEAARADFEANHRGYTFPSTDIALGLRGFHQARQGIGMLGHALGVAFDLLAYDNPNQKLGESGNAAYILDRFGGQGDKRGRSVMTLGNSGEATVAQLGADTAAGKSTPAGDAMVAKIREQFDEMVATSERFKAAMAVHLPELSEARDEYFNGKDTERDLAQATTDEKNADKVAASRLKDEKFSGDDAAKAARREAIKNEISSRKEELQKAVAKTKNGVAKKLEHAFADWAASIDADIAAVRARQQISDAEIAAQTKATKELDAIDVLAPGANDALSAFADQHQLKKPNQLPSAARYKLVLKAELAAKQKPRDKTDPLSPAYLHAELAALDAWQARLHDPRFVFGEGQVVPAVAAPKAAAPTAATPGAPAGAAGSPAAAPGPAAAPPPAAAAPPGPGAAPPTPGTAPPGPAAAPPTPAAAPPKHWATKSRETDAPLMQYIEHGFIRHDDMPARQPGKGAKEVFNVEVATSLARFGFSPGAAFRDTMHFDFIEGYAAAPGGRGQSNMNNKSKFGPSGDVPPPAPKAPVASAAKKDAK